MSAQRRNGEKIGTVGQIDVDDHDGSPPWATVHTGPFGMNESFVPLSSAAVEDHDLRPAVTRAQAKDAPRIDDAHDHLDEAEQARLDRHNGRWTGSGEDRADGGRHTAGRDERARGTVGDDGARTRSQERLRVGTETHGAGTARLRRYVVTENQTVTVPVTHEEVRVEREPIRDGGRSADGRGRATIGEPTHEVALPAERPVVDKRVEEVERVRLGAEKVTEDHTVSEEIRKERVDVDDARRSGTPGRTEG